MEMTREQQIAAIEKDWAENPRWKGVERTYSAEDVVRYAEAFSQQIHLPTVALANCGTLSTAMQRKAMSTALAP